MLLYQNLGTHRNIKIEIKTTTTAVIKNELKYFPMSEGPSYKNKPILTDV